MWGETFPNKEIVTAAACRKFPHSASRGQEVNMNLTSSSSSEPSLTEPADSSMFQSANPGTVFTTTTIVLIL